jgi:N-acetylglutamate synthase-like GNAT family acetyltransferase
MMKFRNAVSDDAPMLDALMVRSKASWGYDDAMMAALRPTYGIDAAYLVTYETVVAEEGGQVVGFYALSALDVLGEQIELDSLFLEPSFIGKGYGKQLWEHAVNAAREKSAERLVLTADPNAEAFYAAQGATTLGEIVSDVVEGRRLPRMVFKLLAPSH